MTFLLAHLSDPHLRTGPVGSEAATGLHRALGVLLALDRRPDAVVVTGDLADHGAPDEYALLADLLRTYPLPVHLAVGNHDDPAAFVSQFGADVRQSVDYPELTIITLDSAGRNGQLAHFDADQLAFLDASLGARPNVPAVVGFHHPPAAIGIPPADATLPDNAADLADVLGRHTNVVRILAGHIHRTIVTTFAGVPVVVAPSTYRQTFLTLRDGDDFAYVHEPPGAFLHLVDGHAVVSHLLPTVDSGGKSGHF